MIEKQKNDREILVLSPIDQKYQVSHGKSTQVHQ